MSESKNAMKAVDELVKSSGSGVNLVNLALLLVIGWNARGALTETLEQQQTMVTDMSTVKTDMSTMKQNLDTLKSDLVPVVEKNSAVVLDLEKRMLVLEGQVRKLASCAKEGKRKCDL